MCGQGVMNVQHPAFFVCFVAFTLYVIQQNNLGHVYDLQTCLTFKIEKLMMDTTTQQQNPENNQISGGGFLYLSLSTVGTSGPHVVRSDSNNFSDFNIQDSYRIEVPESVEYLPTLPFNIDLPVQPIDLSLHLQMNQQDINDVQQQVPIQDNYSDIQLPLSFDEWKEDYQKFDLPLQTLSQTQLPSQQEHFDIRLQVGNDLIKKVFEQANKIYREDFSLGELYQIMWDEEVYEESPDHDENLDILITWLKFKSQNLDPLRQNNRIHRLSNQSKHIRKPQYRQNQHKLIFSNSNTRMVLFFIIAISYIPTAFCQQTQDINTQLASTDMFSLIQLLISFLLISSFYLYYLPKRIQIRGRPKKRNMEKVYTIKQNDVTSKKQQKQKEFDEEQDPRNKGKITHEKGNNAKKFIRSIHTAPNGKQTVLFSAPFKGPAEEGICFVTAYLSLFYPMSEIDLMSREECLKVFKHYTNNGNPVPCIVGNDQMSDRYTDNDGKILPVQVVDIDKDIPLTGYKIHVLYSKRVGQLNQIAHSYVLPCNMYHEYDVLPEDTKPSSSSKKDYEEKQEIEINDYDSFLKEGRPTNLQKHKQLETNKLACGKTRQQEKGQVLIHGPVISKKLPIVEEQPERKNDKDQLVIEDQNKSKYNVKWADSYQEVQQSSLKIIDETIKNREPLKVVQQPIVQHVIQQVNEQIEDKFRKIFVPILTRQQNSLISKPIILQSSEPLIDTVPKNKEGIPMLMEEAEGPQQQEEIIRQDQVEDINRETLFDQYLDIQGVFKKKGEDTDNQQIKFPCDINKKGKHNGQNETIMSFAQILSLQLIHTIIQLSQQSMLNILKYPYRRYMQWAYPQIDLKSQKQDIVVPSLFKDFNPQNKNLTYDRNINDWIDKLPKTGILAVNVLNSQRHMSLFLGQGTAQIIRKSEQYRGIFFVVHWLYSIFLEVLTSYIWAKTIEPICSHSIVRITYNRHVSYLPLWTRQNFDSILSYKIYSIDIGYNVQLLCIDTKDFDQINYDNFDGIYLEEFFVRRIFLQYSQMKCLSMDFKNQKDQDAKFQLIMASATEFTVANREIRDFNDPYGEVLTELHMASSFSNNQQKIRSQMQIRIDSSVFSTRYSAKDLFNRILSPKNFFDLIKKIFYLGSVTYAHVQIIIFVFESLISFYHYASPSILPIILDLYKCASMLQSHPIKNILTLLKKLILTQSFWSSPFQEDFFFGFLQLTYLFIKLLVLICVVDNLCLYFYNLYQQVFGNRIPIRGIQDHISIHQQNLTYYDFNNISNIAIPHLRFFDYYGLQKEFVDAQELFNYYKNYCSCGTTYPKRQILESNLDTNIWAYDKCVMNLLAGVIGRQGAGKTQPDPSFVESFSKFFRSDPMIKDFIDNFVSYSLDEYMEHIRLIDNSKYKMYLSYLEKFKHQKVTKAIMKRDITYTVFSKNGEYHISFGFKPTGKRSRNIFNPSGYLKVLGGWIAYNMKKNLKRTCPHFIGDMDLEHKEIQITEEYRRFEDPIFLSNDGDAHDSRQHKPLIQNIDTFLINQVIEKIYAREPWLSEDQKERITHMVTADQAFVEGYDGKVRVLRATIDGTVFSGHPTRTTFGNTLRVIFYMRFSFYLASITKYALFVCGDDVLAIIERNNLERFKRAFYRVYTTNKSFLMHGLGQVTKGIIDSDQYFSFLSLNGCYDPQYGIRLFRNLPRIMISQQFSDSLYPFKNLKKFKQNLDLIKQSASNSILMSGPGLSFINNFLRFQPKVSESLQLYDSHDTYVGKQYKRLQYTHHKTPIDDEIFLRSACNIGDMEGTSAEKMQSIITGLSNNDFSELNDHMRKGQQIIEQNLYEHQYNTYAKMDSYHNIFRRIPVRGLGREDNINVVEDSSIIIYSDVLYQLLCCLRLITWDVKQLLIPKNNNQKTQSQGGKSGQTKAKKSKNRPVNDDMLKKTATSIQALSKVVNRNSQQEQKYVKSLFKDQEQKMIQARQRGGRGARMITKPMKCSDFEMYRRMVLSPFDSQGVRGPSKFFQPTSLLTYRLEHDFKPGTTDAAICVLPHAFSLQQTTNGFAFYNANKDVVPGVTSTYTFTAQTVVQPNQVYVHPLAGGGSVNNNPVDQNTTQFIDSSKRWLTARCNALGIRIIPTGSSINRAGVLTLGILPGKSQQCYSTQITVPSPTALRQYPTSYEVSVQNIPQTGTDLIWIPLDPSDDIFKCGTANIANDDMTREAFYMSQCWILINGINQGTTGDSFRIEVVTHIEYIPTLPFSTWSPSASTQVTQNQFGSLLNEISQVVPKVIDGELGRKISGGFEVGRKIYETMKLASVLI